MKDRITPLILTYDEEPNLARTLERLRWASEVVVLDSFSTDRTCEIARSFPNVRLVQRRFDRHADQWNFGLRQTGIRTEWVLALDADYVLTDAFLEALERLRPKDGTAGYRARFRYCVDGRPLRGSLYPPGVVLYRAALAGYEQDGHTQRVRLQGPVEDLGPEACIDHDDRKPLSRWMSNQLTYARLEARKLRAPGTVLGWKDRLHGWAILSVPAVLLYCLLVRGALFDGPRGWYYAWQRAAAEMMLALCLLELCWKGPEEAKQ